MLTGVNLRLHHTLPIFFLLYFILFWWYVRQLATVLFYGFSVVPSNCDHLPQTCWFWIWLSLICWWCWRCQFFWWTHSQNGFLDLPLDATCMLPLVVCPALGELSQMPQSLMIDTGRLNNFKERIGCNFSIISATKIICFDSHINWSNESNSASYNTRYSLLNDAILTTIDTRIVSFYWLWISLKPKQNHIPSLGWKDVETTSSTLMSLHLVLGHAIHIDASTSHLGTLHPRRFPHHLFLWLLDRRYGHTSVCWCNLHMGLCHSNFLHCLVLL